MVNEAIILSAGDATRLMPITTFRPKCLVQIRGITLLQRQLNWLASYGISKVALTLQEKHYKSFHNEIPGSITVNVEAGICGTAGGVKKAFNYITGNEALVIYVDDITDINLEQFTSVGSPAIALKKHESRFGIVDCREGLVISFEQKPAYYVFIGISLLSKDLPLPDYGMLETDVFPQLVREQKLKYYIHEGYWRTLNTKRDLYGWRENV